MRFDHAIRKGPMLPGPRDTQSAPPAVTGTSSSLFVPERITPRTPREDERAVAVKALAAVPCGDLLYARVDLIRDSAGSPVLLELELTEPSLFFAHSAGSAERFGEAMLTRARSQEAFKFKT
jgi:O-ureido-D-serine cyclo-ligase